MHRLLDLVFIRIKYCVIFIFDRTNKIEEFLLLIFFFQMTENLSIFVCVKKITNQYSLSCKLEFKSVIGAVYNTLPARPFSKATSITVHTTFDSLSIYFFLLLSWKDSFSSYSICDNGGTDLSMHYFFFFLLFCDIGREKKLYRKAICRGDKDKKRYYTCVMFVGQTVRTEYIQWLYEMSNSGFCSLAIEIDQMQWNIWLNVIVNKKKFKVPSQFAD